MNSGNRERAGSGAGWLRGGLASVLALVLLGIVLVWAAPAWAAGFGQRHGQAPRAEHPAARDGWGRGQATPRGGERPAPGRRDGSVRGIGPVSRPGQAHLPQWLEQHQNLTPSQQENLLRREPGFNRLTPDQQQRVMNRLRFLDSRPPAVRERLAERNEAFERLSPEGKQDVRAAAQAYRQMPAGRQLVMRREFNVLRQLPPEQRQEILNSARFTHTFSPQERHVMSSMLSIEPYHDGTTP